MSKCLQLLTLRVTHTFMDKIEPLDAIIDFKEPMIVSEGFLYC